ncbi:hypothetical protein M9194_01690 [Vibrio sp. S4M6]|uniref:hypothetical protein n=1 Tax=Vibrio sinus TaxID=2946865 RepID=UPI00202A1EE8|nr:hypothetical protein [Vibrio sinus]MCL9780141.1 hypothetical protein [Vibrio sinus]
MHLGSLTKSMLKIVLFLTLVLVLIWTSTISDTSVSRPIHLSNNPHLGPVTITGDGAVIARRDSKLAK